ncbi:uncharacterized protein BP01DRAFT_379528 [Aspergillus saccharolyticus JOP 1030-1]|uniref:Uncharacterized protein n=1 Tax=Aspergillus saccharolyticus JOP 1030-1 TaxID=1450539 RepID=A0A318ZL46_9EURO|nr:hypothetical protein BP01DRAFT_379528 [Aspergillus saccharolyticus JOP 1030-1]PYH48331.1 hypothetical protein BP01DRAFT_379528 [Aspergillus saccharolyticus JOP 1030-1]
MPEFYPSISDDMRDGVLRQSVFLVASAPLQGPNEAAYIDAIGSGSETISHVRDRISVMFCSFDAAPRIVRFFCNGLMIDQPEFPHTLDHMGGKAVVGARAITRLDVFKVASLPFLPRKSPALRLLRSCVRILFIHAYAW